MRTLILTAIVAATISSPALAVTLKTGSPVCISEDLYSQMTAAVFKNDMDAINWLAQNGCTASDRPLKATVIGLSSWGSLAHVRVYRGKYAAELWTARESLDNYDPLKP